jgi:hypothetical protein
MTKAVDKYTAIGLFILILLVNAIFLVYWLKKVIKMVCYKVMKRESAYGPTDCTD